MKLRHFALAAILLLPAAGSQAADSAGSFAVKGVGLSKCSDFVEAVKKQDQAPVARYIGWISGYVSASNQHIPQTFDVTPWQNLRTLTLALVNHCDKNADMRFGEAVVRMLGSLIPDRIQEKTDLVELEYAGQKHYLYKELVSRAQAKLAELGMYTGKIDGAISDSLTDALKTFQTERKLEVTGIPDQKTIFELMRAPR